MLNGTNDIFLSYSHLNSTQLDTVRKYFSAYPLRIWYDNQIGSINPSWSQEIENNLRNSKCVVVLLSPEAKASQMVENEVLMANDAKIPIVPIILRGTANEVTPYPIKHLKAVIADKGDGWLETNLLPAVCAALGMTVQQLKQQKTELALSAEKERVRVNQLAQLKAKIATLETDTKHERQLVADAKLRREKQRIASGAVNTSRIVGGAALAALIAIAIPIASILVGAFPLKPEAWQIDLNNLYLPIVAIYIFLFFGVPTGVRYTKPESDGLMSGWFSFGGVVAAIVLSIIGIPIGAMVVANPQAPLWAPLFPLASVFLAGIVMVSFIAVISNIEREGYHYPLETWRTEAIIPLLSLGLGYAVGIAIGLGALFQNSFDQSQRTLFGIVGFVIGAIGGYVILATLTYLGGKASKMITDRDGKESNDFVAAFFLSIACAIGYLLTTGITLYVYLIAPLAARK